MISFDELVADTKFGVDFVNITFTIKDTSEDITPYVFDLYRSNAESDNFELISSNVQNFEFNDYTVNLLNPEIKYYYKVKATNKNTQEYIFSKPFTFNSAGEDNYTFFFDHLYRMYLDRVINNKPMLLLKRKRCGQLCDCFDDVRRSSRADTCTRCFGTNYVGGFFPPVKILVNYYNTSGESEAFQASGTFREKQPLQFWTVNYPVIQENDMVIDTLTKDRYTVMNVQPSYKNGYLIRQVMQIAQIPKASILYRVPID